MVMRAAVFKGPRSIEVVERPEPVVAPPTEAAMDERRAIKSLMRVGTFP
jgi:hypothetical protein